MKINFLKKISPLLFLTIFCGFSFLNFQKDNKGTIRASTLSAFADGTEAPAADKSAKKDSTSTIKNQATVVDTVTNTCTRITTYDTETKCEGTGPLTCLESTGTVVKITSIACPPKP